MSKRALSLALVMHGPAQGDDARRSCYGSNFYFRADNSDLARSQPPFFAHAPHVHIPQSALIHPPINAPRRALTFSPLSHSCNSLSPINSSNFAYGTTITKPAITAVSNDSNHSQRITGNESKAQAKKDIFLASEVEFGLWLFFALRSSLGPSCR